MDNRTDIGQRRWVIAEGWLPPTGPHPDDRALSSHEAACVLNAGSEDAEVAITIYFSDREPLGPYRLRVPARRTRHIRFDDLTDPAPIPRETDFASVIEASAPIVVQHSRLDMRTGEPALMTTLAHAEA